MSTNPLDALIAQIKGGREFPDAAFSVATTHGVNQAELEAEYDAHCARPHQAPDKVSVYTSSAARASGAEPVRTIETAPHSQFGMDYYQLGGQMFAGYWDAQSGEVYIFADRPVHGLTASA